MWRILCLGTALTLTIPVAVEAADANSRFQAYGLGRLACKRFTDLCESKKDECKLTGTWLEGYLSGFNALNPDTFDLLPWQPPELLAEFTFNVCKQNPEAPVLEVVNELIRTLLVPQRVKAAAERVKIGDGDRAVYLYRETVRTLQERLAAAGHLNGKADGAYGPGTTAAVTSFQKAAGLPETGLPDQRTMLALFYGAPGRPAQAERQAPAPAPTAPAAQAAPTAQTPPARLDLNLIPKTP
jgi:hypothetical protein